MDSQSVRTTAGAGERGYDGARLVAGRKRHLSVDVLGLILKTAATTANAPDREGAK